VFFLTGRDFTSQMSSHWKEGNFARRISYSFIKYNTERIIMRISGSDQCREIVKAIFSYAVSSNNNKSFKLSKCCSGIGVSECITNIGVCEIIIVRGKKNNE